MVAIRRELGEDRADPLRARRRLDVHELSRRAWMNGTSLAKLDSQSMRLISVVTCGYVRNSVSFS